MELFDQNSLAQILGNSVTESDHCEVCFRQIDSDLAKSCIVLLYFIFTPSYNTLVVQYQLVQSCLNYVYIIMIIKEENLNGEGHIIVRLIMAL